MTGGAVAPRDTSGGTAVLAVPAAAALAWAGLAVHNVAELPSVVGPESLWPAVVWVVATALWLTPRARVAGARLLFWWGLVSLVGGAVTVVPLAVLPVDPPQTAAHVVVHVVYATAQVPVVVAAGRWLRRRGRPG